MQIVTCMSGQNTNSRGSHVHESGQKLEGALHPCGTVCTQPTQKEEYRYRFDQDTSIIADTITSDLPSLMLQQFANLYKHGTMKQALPCHEFIHK